VRGARGGGGRGGGGGGIVGIGKRDMEYLEEGENKEEAVYLKKAKVGTLDTRKWKFKSSSTS